MLELSRSDLDVGIVAHSVEAMLHFYGQVVGLPRAPDTKLPGSGIIHKFVVGTNLVKVFETTTPLELLVERTPFPWANAGLNYWSLHVADLDPIVSRLAEHGVEPVSGVIDTGVGIRYMLVHDPDGNVVEFIEGDGGAPPVPAASG